MKSLNLITALLALVIAAVLSADEPTLPVKVGVFRQDTRTFYTTQQGLPSNDVRRIALREDGVVVVRTAVGDAGLETDGWQATTAGEQLLGYPASATGGTSKQTGRILSVARRGEDEWAIGAEHGLFVKQGGDDVAALRQLWPRDATRSWAPRDVFVDYDGQGRLWFACQQGVGCQTGESWSLYNGVDGLPYDDCTAVAGAADGSVWIGTRKGAIRFDGAQWYYRQGKRWLPNDEVRDIAVDRDGNAWVATAGGVAFLYSRAMTLADKAKYYEDEIDARHRRTEFGYVVEGRTAEPGDKTSVQLDDNDNDGLWTSMYGAGECFAYAATKDPKAKQRARAAFQALRFLSLVTRGSSHEPPHGFIARTILETSYARDPNAGLYTLESQRRQQEGDRFWRAYEPRWPRSADGKYYWKSDTSSDELDGHYFFYGLYYDLVADGEKEKIAVREIVRANIDHLIEHDFSLHDHAGRTRWGVFSPAEMNQNPEWFEERGLNSVSMLSYLNVAFHITGDSRYRDVAAELREKHSYHINALTPKHQRGIGTGNQSDDEMAFMSFYNLIRYEPDEKLRRLYTMAFANYWRLEAPEMNPFFNFCFAAVARDVVFHNIEGDHDLSPWPSWLNDSIDTLKRFPLDRFDWRHTNNHRKDLVSLGPHSESVLQDRHTAKGYRSNGKVIPVDERYFNHWNHDPWQLDSGGSGRTIGTGAVFTLPYYMGLYHGFLSVEQVSSR